MAKNTSFKTTTVGLRPQQHAGAELADGEFQNHYGWIETHTFETLS